jgi:hypothetical protein
MKKYIINYAPPYTHHPHRCANYVDPIKDEVENLKTQKKHHQLNRLVFVWVGVRLFICETSIPPPFRNQIQSHHFNH